MHNKVTVVDLDGTLYLCNTFHKFLKYLLKQYWFQYKPYQILRVLLYCLLRGGRCISHKKLKYLVLKQLNNSTVNYEDFVATLSPYYNPIKELAYEPHQLKILATAAPYCYANNIAQLHGFHMCLATQTPQGNFQSFVEQRGNEKKNSVVEYLATKGISTVDLCITDHIDDVPLVKIAKHAIVYNANTQFLMWLRKNFSNFETRNV